MSQYFDLFENQIAEMVYKDFIEKPDWIFVAENADGEAMGNLLSLIQGGNLIEAQKLTAEFLRDAAKNKADIDAFKARESEENNAAMSSAFYFAR